MSAQPENTNPQGVQESDKGKGKEVEMMQESMDEDSSDESGAEEQVRLSARSSAVVAQPANTSVARRRYAA